MTPDERHREVAGFVDDNDTCAHMVEHETEVLFLLYDFMTFLVEYTSQTVQSPVEFPSDQAAFVKSEVEFLIFESIHHIGDFPSHLA